jgi:N-acylglucosamine 2-epimerase
MKRERLKELSAYFRRELIDDTLPFWIEHSLDREFGGFTTYLDRAGHRLSPDKSMWAQCRITWLFARLFNVLERRPDWLELARHGAQFLARYGFDADGRMFFKVTRDGRPLRKRRHLFTECFGAMALAEFSRAADDGKSLRRARELVRLISELSRTPGALEAKVIPRTRKTRGHSAAMIKINLYQVMRDADNDADFSGAIDEAIDDIFRFFIEPHTKVLLETVGFQGEPLLNLPEGRCVNPGHAIETAWFILEEARERRDDELVGKILPILDGSLEIGWDQRHGGLLYFVDVEGKQPGQLEWDMKLWWPHIEAIYATLLAYHLTGESRYADWFERVLGWALDHFPDPQHGEWFGYLHRDGSVALNVKGNHWKGPFHLPRQQLYSHLLLEEMLDS